MFRVLVLGGYGHFGKIIAGRVAGIPGTTVIIAVRDLAKAESCAARLEAQAAALMIGGRLHVVELITAASARSRASSSN